MNTPLVTNFQNIINSDAIPLADDATKFTINSARKITKCTSRSSVLNWIIFFLWEYMEFMQKVFLICTFVQQNKVYTEDFGIFIEISEPASKQG